VGSRALFLLGEWSNDFAVHGNLDDRLALVQDVGVVRVRAKEAPLVKQLTRRRVVVQLEFENKNWNQEITLLAQGLKLWIKITL
jgi:hypothetical protein